MTDEQETDLLFVLCCTSSDTYALQVFVDGHPDVGIEGSPIYVRNFLAHQLARAIALDVRVRTRRCDCAEELYQSACQLAKIKLQLAGLKATNMQSMPKKLKDAIFPEAYATQQHEDQTLKRVMANEAMRRNAKQN